MPPPYHTVLCPTDLSDAGNLAVALAYAVVEPWGVVHLLHVSPAAGEVGLGDAAPDEVLLRHRHAHAELWKLVPPTAAARAVRTEVHTVADGDPRDEILAEARMRRADVIVMSEGGRPDPGTREGDSVTVAVMRNALVPVILAPATAEGG